MTAPLALLGLHLKPPVREPARDAVAVEARKLARAQRLTLRALPRSAAAGPIGRAALGFVVSAEAPAGDEGGQLRRLVGGISRIRAVTAVSVLVRPPAAGAPAGHLPTAEVEAAEFEQGGEGALLPDRVYLVSGTQDVEPSPRGAPPGPGLEPARRRLAPGRREPNR